MTFTKTVNRFFRGNYIDVEPTNRIEKEAKEFYRKKKHIGKYLPKVEVCKDNRSTNAVINIPGKEKSKKVDVKRKMAIKVKGAKSCDNKENMSSTEVRSSKRSNIQKEVIGKSHVNVTFTKSCEKKRKIEKSVIKKAAKTVIINPITKPVMTQNNMSCHKMELRKKNLFTKTSK